MQFAKSTLSLSICTALFPIFAFAENETGQVEVKLNTIVVEAKTSDEVGKTSYNKEDLEKTPNSQKTISEFLKVNTNVQFSNSDQSASSQAEIHASDLSIHGALPYNNNFLVNGISFNNDINPYAGKNDINSISSLGGSSQAITLNTDLLCNLEVLDSNVSAQYGQFTGGVISATTCAPKTEIGKIYGSITYDYTNSAWNRFNYIDADEEAQFNDPSQKDAQKNYSKKGLSFNTYGRLTDAFGVNLGLSQRKSDINANSQLADARPYNEERLANNLNLEFFYDPSDDLSVKLGLQHYEDESLRFTSNTLTDGITQNSDSDSIQLNIDKRFDLFTLKQSLSYQKKQNARISSGNEQFSWYKSDDKNWGSTNQSTEGMSGTIESEQKNFEYNTSALFTTLNFLDTTHTFNVGAGFSHHEAKWQRPDDFTAYFLPGAKNLGTDCIKTDGTLDHACDPSFIPSKNISGQYSATKTVHEIGNIDVQQDTWNVFAEDRINWNNKIEAVLGLRYDYDSLSKNGNIAPRAAFHYLPFADQSVKFSTGWNRYYDRYLYNFDLQDGINSLQTQYTRTNLNSDWIAKAATSKINVSRSELDLPYADEWLLGMSAETHNWRTQLKYVNRDYKDQYYLTLPDPTNVWTRKYTNEKAYSSENVTLDITNIAPIEALNAKHRFNIGISYTDTQRDFNNADAIELKEYSHVFYNGKLVNPSDIPASDFNVPLTARLSWDFKPNNLAGLNISNFLVYQPRYDGITKTSIPAKEQISVNGLPVIYSYNDTDIPSVVRWDLRASYTHNFHKDLHAIFGLTVNNLTNRHNKYLDSDYYLKSEIGRQFIADITFKF